VVHGFSNVTVQGIHEKTLSTKRKFSLQGLVEVHHILPRQFRAHDALSDFDIDSGSNLMFMPTRAGKTLINTVRPCHEGGHRHYNEYVLRYLNSLPTRNNTQEVHGLIRKLRLSLMESSPLIPWTSEVNEYSEDQSEVGS